MFGITAATIDQLSDGRCRHRRAAVNKDNQLPHARRITNHIVDDFADQLYALMTRTEAIAQGFSGADLEAIAGAVWEKAAPVLHEVFRARAIRMLQGDL